MIEPNLLEIPSEVICTALCETVENISKSKDVKIIVSAASKTGEDNFVGIVYRVVFHKGNEPKNVNKLILKVAPQNPARRKQFFSHACFLQEIYMYNEVLPLFRDFERSSGVNSEECGFHEYPKCYRTLSEEPNECLLLEDLSVRDFHIIDRFKDDVTFDHVRLVMQALAKFHAISFALKDQQPENFNRIASKLKETFFRKNNDGLRGFFDKQTETIFGVLSNEGDAHLLAKVKQLFTRPAVDILFDCIDNKFDAVITHADTWQNNFLFKYDGKGNPVKISLVDWQIARHASPILDIVYFIFSCTTKELRDAHYEEFLEIYHKNLSLHIRRLGSDPEVLFPLSRMQEHMRKFAKFGLLMACLLLNVVTMDRKESEVDLDEYCENIDKQKDAADGFLSAKARKRYDQRLHDVIVDMVRLEYI